MLLPPHIRKIGLLVPETMCMVGKSGGWALVAALTCDLKDGLLFIWGKMSGSWFLVDTGAEVSAFFATGLETRTKWPGPSLVAGNGSTIKT